jgi:hypothetical protein
VDEKNEETELEGDLEIDEETAEEVTGGVLTHERPRLGRHPRKV